MIRSVDGVTEDSPTDFDERVRMGDKIIEGLRGLNKIKDDSK